MGSYRPLAMRINKREKAENKKKVTREHIMATRGDDMPYRGERYPLPLLLLPATASTPSLYCDLSNPPHVRAGPNPGATGP